MMKVFRPLIILTNAEMEEYYNNMALEGWKLCRSSTVADFFEKGEKQEEHFCVIPEQAEIPSDSNKDLILLGRHKWYQVYRQQKKEKIVYEIQEGMIKQLWLRLVAGFIALLWIFCVIIITSENQLKLAGFPWLVVYSISVFIELFAFCWGAVRRIREEKNYKQENTKIFPSSYKKMMNIQKLVTLNHFILIGCIVFLWRS